MYYSRFLNSTIPLSYQSIHLFSVSLETEIDLFQFFWKELELLGARVYEAEDFDWAIDLIASGKIDVKKS